MERIINEKDLAQIMAKAFGEHAMNSLPIWVCRNKLDGIVITEDQVDAIMAYLNHLSNNWIEKAQSYSKKEI